jgi:isocitrate lyase
LGGDYNKEDHAEIVWIQRQDCKVEEIDNMSEEIKKTSP